VCRTIPLTSVFLGGCSLSQLAEAAVAEAQAEAAFILQQQQEHQRQQRRPDHGGGHSPLSQPATAGAAAKEAAAAAANDFDTNSEPVDLAGKFEFEFQPEGGGGGGLVARTLSTLAPRVHVIEKFYALSVPEEGAALQMLRRLLLHLK
jgi:hypothetical protein